MDVKLEKLNLHHAEISYVWRNNPKIWEYTVNRPDIFITLKSERKWLRKVLSNSNEERFAITVKGKYIGNSYLTNIHDRSGTFHIFIGETDYWGKGIAKKATILLLKFAFVKLTLKKVNLRVRKNHSRAIGLYHKLGFKEVSRDQELIWMEISKRKFNEELSK